MELTPKEKDKLLLFTVAMLAERRLERGVTLNYPEAVAYISMHIIENARDGKSVAELMSLGRTLLSTDQVMDGVAGLIHDVQVEATFPDGTKLVTVHEPIQPVSADSESSELQAGEIVCQEGTITINEGRESITVEVCNEGDRPIQIGSHYHFYEANPSLSFEREITRGFRLNIAAGTAVRFEPGQKRTVNLVALSGKRRIFGFNQEVMGEL